MAQKERQILGEGVNFKGPRPKRGEKSFLLSGKCSPTGFLKLRKILCNEEMGSKGVTNFRPRFPTSD